jgi:hypothetical protein
MAGEIRARSWPRALALACVLTGCHSSAAPGGFEDDLGDAPEDGDTLLPDLPQAECNPRRLNECDEGQKCSYVVDPELGPTNACVPLMGEGEAGEPCEQVGESDTCAALHICWATGPDGVAGTCVAYCNLSLACDEPGEICSVSDQGLLTLCLPKCDPLLQDCPEGWGCYADDYQRWACDRDQSGPGGAHGELCSCLNCCDPGLVCLSGGRVDGEGCGEEGVVAGCCAAVCSLEAPVPPEEACPSEAERCEPFYDSDAVLMGYEKVGICEL